MSWTPEAKKVVEKFYSEQVEPILTPVTVDPAHPFPRVLNKALCVAFLLRRRKKPSEVYLGVVTVPRALAPAFAFARRRGRDRIRVPARHRARLFAASLSRLRNPLGRAVSRHAQQQSLSARGGIAQHSGFGGHAAASCAGKGPRSAWKSSKAPIRKLSSDCGPISLWLPGKCFRFAGPSICRGSSTSTTRRRGRI